MKKKEFIKRYGQSKYEEMLKQRRGRTRNSYLGKQKEWRDANPEVIKFHHAAANRKGGMHYEKRLRENREGLQGDRGRIRRIDGNRFRRYKPFFAKQSQLHHEWIPGTAKYRGIALVEQEQHMRSIIDVFMVLEGEITVFNEQTGAYK